MPFFPTEVSTIQLQLTPANHRVYGYGYDAAREVLAIRFKSPKDNTPGAITYEYPGVTAEAVAALDAADSKGSHIDKAFVKTKHPFTKMLAEAPAAE